MSAMEDLSEYMDFNPLPPHGGRPVLNVLATGLCIISIHSLRMEGDAAASYLPPHEGISIHSLRMEGDRLTVFLNGTDFDFNPLPPHGGRLFCRLRQFHEFRFQSTPSAWRETDICNVCHGYFQFQSTPSAWRETR